MEESQFQTLAARPCMVGEASSNQVSPSLATPSQAPDTSIQGQPGLEPASSQAASSPVASAPRGPKACLKLATQVVMGQTLRLAERVLPVPLLKAALWPVAVALAAKRIWSGMRLHAWHNQVHALGAAMSPISPAPPTPPSPPAPTPHPLSRGAWFIRHARAHIQVAMSYFLRYWPDRMIQPRWASLCETTGMDHLRAALATGRPVVLATFHYGDLTDLYHRLRAMGLASAFLAHRHPGPAHRYQAWLDDLEDQADGLVGVRHLFGLDQLWEAWEFLKVPGRILGMVIERTDEGRKIWAQGPGFEIQVAPGAFRIAFIANAVVIPCVLDSPGCLSCRIHFGAPVPDECVRERKRYQAGFDHIVQELAPMLLARPELWQPQLRDSFRLAAK